MIVKEDFVVIHELYKKGHSIVVGFVKTISGLIVRYKNLYLKHCHFKLLSLDCIPFQEQDNLVIGVSV